MFRFRHAERPKFRGCNVIPGLPQWLFAYLGVSRGSFFVLQKVETSEFFKNHLKTSKMSENNNAIVGDADKKPVRLTEDLLYLVNKQLKKMDTEERMKKIKDRTHEHTIFKAISYRKKPPRESTQAGQAVMHKMYFDSNATAEADSDEFVIFQVDLWDEWDCRDGFMDRDQRPLTAEVSRPDLFRFVKLPADYERPNPGYEFFDELTWKEGGSILAKAAQIPQIFMIYDFRTWIYADPRMVQPLHCCWRADHDRPVGCPRRVIYHVLWLSELFRSIFQRSGVNRLAEGPFNRFEERWFIRDAMMEFGAKLTRGEVALHDDHGLNLLAAFQIKMLAEKFDNAHYCNCRPLSEFN